jgi:biopolymer transport protein TolR
MNVTPLVDIVLVLLIIFMVITPQMEAGAAVTLPGILNVDPANKGKLEPITLSLTASGQLYLEKDPVTREELIAQLEALHQQFPDRRLLLKGDRGVKYGDMRRLFASVQDVGFQGIAMQVGDKRQQRKE